MNKLVMINWLLHFEGLSECFVVHFVSDLATETALYVLYSPRFANSNLLLTLSFFATLMIEFSVRNVAATLLLSH